MLDMDARDLEDLGELLQALGGGQRTKRSIQGEAPMDISKKARTERMNVGLYPTDCFTASSLGVRRKEVGPNFNGRRT